MFKFFLLVALVPAVVLADVNFRACPDGAPTPTSLAVNNCSENGCVLSAGQPFYALAKGIVSPVGSSTATAYVVVRMGDVEIDYQVPAEQVDACRSGIVGGCPIIAGTLFNYATANTDLNIQTGGLQVEIEFGLNGDGGVKLGCVRFDAYIE